MGQNRKFSAKMRNFLLKKSNIRFIMELSPERGTLGAAKMVAVMLLLIREGKLLFAPPSRKRGAMCNGYIPGPVRVL